MADQKKKKEENGEYREDRTFFMELLIEGGEILGGLVGALFDLFLS